MRDEDKRKKQLIDELVKMRRRVAELEALIVENKDAEISEDFTELKRALDLLATEKDRLAVTLRSMGDGVIATDAEGRITLINRVAEAFTGWSEEEAIGKSLGEVFHIVNQQAGISCENPAEEVLKSGKRVTFASDLVLISRDGAERVIADSSSPILDNHAEIIGVVVVFRDITGKREIEKEVLKAQKLECIGTLAGGIAHDFNNILTGILGNISLARMYKEPQKIAERLTEAERASLRARDLTQRLLTFSHGGAPIRKITAIADMLEDAANFVLNGSNVRCEFSIPEDLWPVEIDKGQINQAIINIITNADQAMPEGGIIKVIAENMNSALPMKDGQYVKISIRDCGIGIPQEHLQKIFDPYFTTKQKGSGLGLTSAYSIIKNHDGYITVESTMGAGTTVYIYLPAFQKSLIEDMKNEANQPPGKGRILVIDDEEIIRELTGDMITNMGYEVTVVTNGEEGIASYRKSRELGIPFDAVMIDLIIPGGLGGKEIVQKLIEIDPQVKAIVSSGYSRDPIMSDFRKYGFKGVIAKPYKVKELSEILYRIIMEL